MGRLLSNLAKGSLVKLNEDTQAKKFIVLDVDHYGTGTGVTLIRKDSFTPTAWNAASTNYQNHYMGCTLDNICDGIWPQKLDPEIRACIVPVPIIVAEGNGVTTLHTIYRKAFALSCTEVGLNGWQTEGKAFSYFSDNAKRICYVDESSCATLWGLRSPYSDTIYACYVSAGGALNDRNVYLPYFAARPAFNLKSSIVVSNNPDGDGCYVLESLPVAGGGTYIKNNGLWVQVG